MAYKNRNETTRVNHIKEQRSFEKKELVLLNLIWIVNKGK